MKSVKDIRVCVVDHGQFVAVARKIGEQVAKCYYWSPADRSMPVIQEAVIGDGFPEIERVESIWPIKDQCDLFVFPDVGMSGLQRELIRQGYPVWGARESDSLETKRGKFLNTINGLGMEMPKYETVRGLTNLRLFLKDKEDRFIKMSKWRGNFETFHWSSWAEGEGELDGYAVEFGPLKEHLVFYVFEPIDTEIEDGLDAYCVDGKYPSVVMHGMECKDKSYLGTVTEWDALPKELTAVNEAFAPALMDYRSFFSTEVRITKEKKSYFIDPTCRCGSPPHQLMTEMFGNFADIIWHGANGECIDPEPTAEFGVQALLSYSRNDREWASFQLHEDLEPQAKCGFCCRVDNRLVFPPHPLESMAGYLVATGSSIAEAIQNLQGLAKELPSGLKCETQSIAELLKEVETAEDAGMTFTDKKVPAPATVLEEA